MADLLAKAGEHLAAGEVVLASVRGKTVRDLYRPKAVLVATDRRLIFYVAKIVGEEVAAFQYGKVSGLGVSKGMTGHIVTFTAGVNVTRLDRVKGGPALDEFRKVVEEKLEATA